MDETNEIELEVNSCIDEPSDKDYLFEEVFWSSEQPEYVNWNSTQVYDQSSQNNPKTTYACTCYSATHCVNEGNFLEIGAEDNIDPVRIWKIALERGAKIDSGWSLQGSQKIMRDLGYTDGHTRCSNLGDVKSALARKQLVQTGSKSIDWKKTRENANIAVYWEAYWHAFIIQWYDDSKSYLICRNSYWPNKYDQGLFFVKYDDFKLLYTCYAYVDADSKAIIEKEQEKRRLAEAVKKWIWNGERPDDLLTRFEASAIALRIGTKIDIWNGKDGQKPVLTRELVAMLERATGKKFSFVIKDPDKTITRKNGVLLAVRI